MNAPTAGSQAYIDPVSGSELDAAKLEGRVDAGTKQLLAAEAVYIGARRDAQGRTDPADELKGLAISGGGIRSATFALGVLQALAKRRLLEKIDYLSTVSGGGYIGSSLSWFLSPMASATEPQGNSEFGVGPDDFPYGTDAPDTDPTRQEDRPRQRALLKFLRSHGKYLAPGKGITILSLGAVLVRAMFLNLLMWVPMITAGLLALIAIRAAGIDLFSVALGGAAGVVALFAVGSIAYSLGTWLSRRQKLLKRYKLRRAFERVVGTGVAVGGGAFVLGSIPFAHGYIQQWALAAGTSSVLAGIASGLRTFVKSGKPGGGGVPLPVMASAGAFLFLYGILLTGYDLASRTMEWIQGVDVVGMSDQRAVGIAVIVLIALAIVTGRFVNLNYISVHRYYRDRLMETFLPDLGTALQGATGPASKADGARLSGFADPKNPRGPYHIINTNVVLVNDKDRTRRIRGGDAFGLAPYYSGSSATGWRRTKLFADDGMTLPTAMAISGAALQPNTGVGGVGLSRNKLVALLMSLLNLRLGYWTLNPGRERQTGPKPNHFSPGLNEVDPRGGHAAHRRFLEISDGGHFENLGLYELIRRRIKLIIVSDGGADPKFAFRDLQNAIRRVWADFGARITFDDNNALERLIPSGQKPAGYPQGVNLAERSHVVGTIRYSDGSEGQLVYVKTTLFEGLSLDLLGYKGAHPTFPDESTADQFFDEDQVEAYRKLGYATGMQIPDLDDLGVSQRPGESSVPLRA